MKVIALDKESNGRWYKQWETLYSDIKVMCCGNDVCDKAMNDTVLGNNGDCITLLLVHQSKCGPSVETRLKLWEPLWESRKLFVLFVHGDGCKPNKDNHYSWVHYCTRRIGSGVGLEAHKGNFENLMGALAKAKSDDEIRGAWEGFDPVLWPRLIEFLSPYAVITDEEMLKCLTKSLDTWTSKLKGTELLRMASMLGASGGEGRLQQVLSRKGEDGKQLMLGTELLEWVKDYPSDFRRLARRFL